jgi:hypothetical protein
MGDAPSQADSFGAWFGKLKSGAQEDAARLMGGKGPVTSNDGRATVEAQNARPYDAPRLSGNRAEAFPAGASDLDHLQASRFERIPLTREDARNAIAHVANLSGIEYMGRMSGWKRDEAVYGSNGSQTSPDQLGAVIGNLKIDEAALKGAPAPGLDQLMQSAQEARASGKSLVLVKDHASLPDEQRATVLNEELNHAMQRAATGPLDKHLGASAKGFIEGPLGSRAVQALEQNLEYHFRSPGEAATEVGVRLMQPNQYQELGLSRAEARALASEYMQRLDKEYGHAAVSKIASRIIDAFR